MKSTLLIFLFFYLTAGVVSGQWSNRLGGDNSPVCVMPDTQYNVQVVSDGNDGAYIAWEDKRSGRWRIYIQYVNANGAPQWTASGIPVCSDTVYQRNFDMQKDGSGGVLLAWEERRFNRNSIFAQRINSSGNLLWGNEGLNIFDSLNSFYPKILSSNGNAIISWHSNHNNDFSAEMHIQKVNSSGVKLWGTSGKRLTNQMDDQWYAEITSVGNENTIIVWAHGTGFYQLFAQKVDQNGNTLWASNGVPISSYGTALVRLNQEIVSNGNGGAIVVWEQEMSHFGPYHIYAQNISSSGMRLWQSQGIPVESTGTINYLPFIITVNPNSSVISWNHINSNGRTNVRLQRLNYEGSKLWDLAGIQLYPDITNNINVVESVVSDENGGTVLTSFESRNGLEDIYSYKLDSNGFHRWDSLGISICIRDSLQLLPRICKINSGFIIAWEDQISGMGDIYCQKINNGGILIGVSQIGNETPTKFSLYQNYPNPFNPSTSIKFDILGSGGMVKLSVFNSLGQEIRVLVNENLSGGTYEYPFDGAKYASGVYFYSIQTDGFTDTKKMLLVK